MASLHTHTHTHTHTRTHTQTGGNAAEEVGDGGAEKDGGGIIGLSQYLASVEEEESSDDDWDD